MINFYGYKGSTNIKKTVSVTVDFMDTPETDVAGYMSNLISSYCSGYPAGYSVWPATAYLAIFFTYYKQLLFTKIHLYTFYKLVFWS